MYVHKNVMDSLASETVNYTHNILRVAV